MATGRESDTPSHVDRIADAVCSSEYWLSQIPGMSIEQSRGKPVIAIGEELAAQFQENVHREGYFQCEGALTPDIIAPLRECVLRLQSIGCPLAFAFVFDEFWELAARLEPLLSRLLGPAVRQLPDFWVWCIDPAREQAGWPPHRDKGAISINSDGSPKSLTIWIPLTDATPLNGCMYVVPSLWDKRTGEDKSADQLLPANMQDVRAIPAPAGSILGWNQALLHWGGRASQRAAEPRISVALEFQRGDVKPFNLPLLDPRIAPPFQTRLGLIGKQILQYRHMYGLPDGVARLGERLRGLLRESS